jgi:hypothetical protein
MRGRPTKRRTGAKKSAKAKTARSKAGLGLARKASATATKKAKKKVVRKAAAPTRKKAVAKKTTARKTTAKKTAAKRTSARKTPTTKRTRRPVAKEIFGEGNDTAAREFRREQTGFARRNRDNIPAMGQGAAAALDGEEGAQLEEAEDQARAHSHAPGDEE